MSRLRRSGADGSGPNEASAPPARTGPATVFDYRPPDDRVSQIRRVPGLTWLALRLVWAADRKHLSTTILLQVIAAAAIAVQLLITRRLLEALVDLGNGGSVSALYPWLGALALITAVLGVVAALTNYEQKLLVELASRHAFDRIIEVSVAVDFESFEDAEFYDQLQRARNSGLFRLIDMVNSVTALTTGVLTSIGIAVVLFVLQPILLVFVAIAAVFPLLATILNSRAAYVFEHGLTADGRERQYLMELLTEREPAKEIRIFGAGPFLHRRYAALTDDRVRQLRVFLHGRLKVALLGSAGGLLGTIVALGALIVLLDTDRMTAATALTAALAMQQLGSRLTAVTTSAGRLIESSMFIHDFRAFLERASEVEMRTTSAQVGKVPLSGESALEVRNVTFRYPGSERVVLDDVSLAVEPGEVVALVGENGSGKTTLVKLICQLYRPDSGLILWNGTDASAVSPEDVRNEMTVLFQDYVQYHLTVRDNILLGRPERTGDDDAAVRTAAAARARTASSRTCPTATTRGSAANSTEATNSRSGSGSGWRWHGHSSAAEASSSSTSRPHRSTLVPRPTCSRRCAGSHAAARCSSSRTDSPACDRPTASTCSRPGAWSSTATTIPCWRTTACTPSSSRSRPMRTFTG